MTSTTTATVPAAAPATIIVRMQFGSHLYGTNTPQSDLDYKGIFIPPASDILLQRARGTISTKRAKGDGEKNYAGEIDEESYALHRFMQLIAEGQTVSLDMLFAPESALLQSSICWQVLMRNRGRLLTKKSTAFVGYCRTQANKYGIRGSRVASARAAAALFAAAVIQHGAQERVGIIASQLRTFTETHEHAQLIDIPAQKNGAMLTHFECCNKKMPFSNSLKSAADLYARIYEEYGHRARQAEHNEGIDWKALSHAVRVAREAVELLETGHITFPLPYAAHILQIKAGGLSYDVVAEEIEQLLEAVESAAEKSLLPDAPDLQFMEEIVKLEYMQEIFNVHHLSR